MGCDTSKLKLYVIILVALGVGAVVALTGLIGFVGLVVPHIARLMVGPHLRNMLPLCMLLGVIVLLLSDWLANSAVEAVVDRVSDDWHELSGRAKDIGSAAVFVALTLALFIWASFLL